MKFSSIDILLWTCKADWLKRGDDCVGCLYKSFFIWTFLHIIIYFSLFNMQYGFFSRFLHSISCSVLYFIYSVLFSLAPFAVWKDMVFLAATVQISVFWALVHLINVRCSAVCFTSRKFMYSYFDEGFRFAC